jgi:hypothetical protein
MKDWLIETELDKVVKYRLEQEVIQYEFDKSKLPEVAIFGIERVRQYYPDDSTKQSLFLFAVTKAVAYSNEILEMPLGTVKQEVIEDLVEFYGVADGLILGLILDKLIK